MSTISIIAAIAENNAIGKNNKLLWRLPADMRRFKDLTTGHAVIMGRKTFESLPKGPLPNRKNVVLTTLPEAGFVTASPANQWVRHWISVKKKMKYSSSAVHWCIVRLYASQTKCTSPVYMVSLKMPILSSRS